MMSRPGTQQSRPYSQASHRLPPLPLIKHPLAESRPGPQNLYGINVQRNGTPTGRPLPAEETNDISRSNLIRNNHSFTPDHKRDMIQHRNITERQYSFRNAGQECVDREVLSPYVGERGYRDIKTPSDNGSDKYKEKVHRFRTSSRASTTVNIRIEVDELEVKIREKCRNNQTEVQKRFRDNDSQSNGTVSKEALLRVLVTLTGQPISYLQFQKLLVRFGLDKKQNFHYSDFIDVCRTSGNNEVYPHWMTKVTQGYNESPNLNANQVHSLLKDKAEQKLSNLFGMIPQTTPDGARRLLKPEFRNALTQLLQVNMTDEEFDKLWKKYDEENTGVIDSRKLSEKLGIKSETSKELDHSTENSTNCLRRKEADRKRSLDIEVWLKDKFRQGYYDMKKSFLKLDKDHHGLIPATDFCNILEKFDLKLSMAHLDEFLSRCGIVRTTDGVPYIAFLKMFQDRSENGMTNKILADVGHRYNRADYSDRDDVSLQSSSMSVLEAQLMNMFQRDFLSLLGTFHTLDHHRDGYVSQDEFRAVVESAFDMHLTEDQFDSLLDKTPLTKNCQVKYPEFMAQFDSNGDLHSLKSGSIPSEVPDIPPDSIQIPRRDTEELSSLIRQLLTNHFEDVEQQYATMDAYNSQTLTQESFYELVNKFNIHPPITRGEVRELWQTLITNKDNSLSWQQFIRQFGFTGQTHTYMDAGRNPPKMGDSDYFVKSNTLNSDYELLLDSSKHRIEYKWEDLRRAFRAVDPHQTGCVSEKEFSDILSNVCVHLSTFDLQRIIIKHAVSDERVNYLNFLDEFGPNRKVWQNGNDMFSLLSHPRSPLPLANIVEPPQKGLIGISAKLRNKLSGSWKNLRRAFQKLDKDGSGYLPLPQFRKVLQLANVVLDEDEVYFVMSALDEDLTGKLNYNRFLGQLFRPESQRSSRASSRASGLMPLSRQSMRHSTLLE